MNEDDELKEQLFNEIKELREEVRQFAGWKADRENSDINKSRNILEMDLDLFEKFMDTAQVIILFLDPDGKILLVNPYMENLSGYRLSEIRGKDWFDVFVPKNNRKRLKKFFNEAKKDIRTIGAVNKIIASDGRSLTIEWYDRTIKDQSGKVLGLLSIGLDISERIRVENELKEYQASLEKLVEERTAELEKINQKLQQEILERQQTEVALRESERRYKRLLEAVTDYVYTVYLKDNRVISTHYHPSCISVTGYSAEEYEKDTYLWHRTIHPDDQQIVLKHAQKLMAGETVAYIEHRIIHKDKSIRWVRNTPVLHINENGDLNSYDGIISDITEQKLAEAKFRNLVESAPDAMIIVHRDGQIAIVNSQVETLFGYARQELLDQSIELLIPQRFRKRHTLNHPNYFAHPNPHPRIMGWGIDVYARHKDGHEFPVEVSLSPLETKDGLLVISTIRDITERKEIEEQLKIHSLVLENMAEGVSVSDAGGTVFYTNPTFDKMFGFDRGDITGKHMSSLFYGMPKETMFKVDEISTDLDNHGAWYGKINNRKKDGSSFITYARISVLQIKNKTYWISVQEDITEDIKAEEKIKASLKEKEVLLQEIHHRVKNNLAIISSFLGLQSQTIDGEDILYLFRQAQDRVYTMSLIHEKLYQSEDLASINARDFLQSLSSHLLTSYAVGVNRVSVTTDIEEIWLQIDEAIPCGLIVNELISNALKYAFPGELLGEIGISLKNVNKEYLLIIRDTGVGMPGDIDIHSANSLGLRLVNALTMQLQGKLQLVLEQGTEFLITFPIKNKEE